MLPDAVDVVIIGAGPSGSTLAGLLRKYRPQTRVLVVEKLLFPRHKIGESLLVDVNRILVDLGAYAQVEAAGFSRKYGATFIWGDEREPFHFLWKEGATIARAPEGYQLNHTWHVDRPEYDSILADAARRHGAEIVYEQAVTRLLFDGDRVTGVEVRGPDGQLRTVAARFVVDCAGAQGPAHRQLCKRQLDESLRNIAVFGYMRGVADDLTLNGTDEKRTLILTHDQGWVWVIPLRDGITSVGFVTAVDNYRRAGVEDHRAYYTSIIQSLREYPSLFADAELVDYRGDGKLVHSVQEYSYQCEQIAGPGWATCGNAAGFVDAILSIGVYVAQTHAQFLACALRSVLDGAVPEHEAFACYATTVRENLGAFRAVAHLFYAFNGSMSDWWRGCSAQLRNSTLVPSTEDKGAFLAYFTGFSARSAIYHEAINAFGGSFLLDVSAQLFGEQPLFAGGGLSAEASRARALVKRNPVLELDAGVSAQGFWLPDVQAGGLAPVTRVDIRHDGLGASPDIAKRLYLPAALAEVMRQLDGRCSLAQHAARLVADGVFDSPEHARLEVSKLAYRLACMGAVHEAGPEVLGRAGAPGVA
jgi:flavin-dependent dehydrogenase